MSFWCQMSSLCYTRLCLNLFFLTFWNRHLLKEKSSSGRAAPQSCFFRKNVIFNHQQWFRVCVSVLTAWTSETCVTYITSCCFSLWPKALLSGWREGTSRNLFIKQASNIGNMQLLQNLHRGGDNDYLSAWMYYTLSNLIILYTLSRAIFPLASIYSINKAIVAIMCFILQIIK